MSRLIRPLRNSISIPFSSTKTLIPQLPGFLLAPEKQSSLRNPNLVRTYISEMRKSTFEGNILRLLRSEIQREFDASPPYQPVSEFSSFIVDNRSVEQWITLKKKFGDNEDIKIESTMFDGSVPVTKTAANENGGEGGQNVHLHISMIVNISKGKGGNKLEIMCSVWPDTIEINKLFVRKQENKPAQPYMGPGFKELDDELQESLYKFLEARGIGDDLAIFLHSYMKNKDKTEFVEWMGTVKLYIEKKKSSGYRDTLNSMLAHALIRSCEQLL